MSARSRRIASTDGRAQQAATRSAAAPVVSPAVSRSKRTVRTAFSNSSAVDVARGQASNSFLNSRSAGRDLRLHRRAGRQQPLAASSPSRSARRTNSRSSRMFWFRRLVNDDRTACSRTGAARGRAVRGDRAQQGSPSAARRGGAPAGGPLRCGDRRQRRGGRRLAALPGASALSSAVLICSREVARRRRGAAGRDSRGVHCAISSRSASPPSPPRSRRRAAARFVTAEQRLPADGLATRLAFSLRERMPARARSFSRDTSSGQGPAA